MSARIALTDAQMSELCRRWGLTEIGVFGSVTRDDFDPETSDIDVIVAFSDERRRSYFDLFRLRDELEGLLGRKVDLLTKKAVLSSRNHFRRDEMMRDYTVLHGAA